MTAEAAREWVCYAGGRFVPEAQATVSVLDHAVLYGDGVFDTVVAWQGRVFRLDDHLDRLFRSMAAVAIEPPADKAAIRALTCEAVARNGLADAYVKLIVTRGSNGRPLMDPTGCRSTLIILTRPYIHRAPSDPDKAIALKTAAIRRPPGDVLDGRIKSLNYLNLVQAKLEAKAAQADEALMLDLRGQVCEAPGYNVFVVREGRMATPRRDVLAGITRDSVFEIARAEGVEAIEADLELYDIYTADEVFLTSTAGGLVPVGRVDGRAIGSGRPGPVFRRFSEAYLRMLADERWSVPVGT